MNKINCYQYYVHFQMTDQLQVESQSVIVYYGSKKANIILGLMGALERCKWEWTVAWFVQTCLKQVKINQSIVTWQVGYMT